MRVVVFLMALAIFGCVNDSDGGSANSAATEEISGTPIDVQKATAGRQFTKQRAVRQSSLPSCR